MLRFAAENPEEAARLAQSQSEPYAPIVIQPLANDPIVTKPIEIKPITIEPIQISSLKACRKPASKSLSGLPSPTTTPTP